MVAQARDDFNREDGQLGSDWTVASGSASILDEAVRPIDSTGSQTPSDPSSPLDGLASEVTQIAWTKEALDLPNYGVRGVWGHDDVTPSQVTGDPSFTILARATKDPLLIDLAGEDSIGHYDQAYGLRVTCPLDGSAPILKIIKLTPDRRINQASNSTGEPDDATVLAQATLTAADLNTQDGETVGLYKGMWQDMRLHVRGADGRVQLDAYLNDRYENQPILSYVDQKDPVWSAVGVPAMQFLSPVKDGAASPLEEEGVPVMACTLFEVQILQHLEQPRTISPSTRWTYGRIVDRVITLVERNGDAKYSQTLSGQQKRDTYLDFVLEAESDLIRSEGYWDWLRTSEKIYLSDGVSTYRLPDNFGLMCLLYPANYQGQPLREIPEHLFQERVSPITQSSGKPQVYSKDVHGDDGEPRIKVFPAPRVGQLTDSSTDPYLTLEYYRQQIRPRDMDSALPVVPQHAVDVLIYGAAAHALLLDTDGTATQMMAAVYASKLKALRRENNRKVNNEFTIARPVNQVYQPASTSRVPLLRATQLETLLF